LDFPIGFRTFKLRFWILAANPDGHNVWKSLSILELSVSVWKDVGLGQK
jgi:hypothetical protein